MKHTTWFKGVIAWTRGRIWRGHLRWLAAPKPVNDDERRAS
jgi:hypothetical protein